MKTTVVFLFIFPAAALAQAPGGTATTPKAINNPGEMLCMRDYENGSRIATRRVCMTRAEWAEMRRQNRQSTERAQLQQRPPQAISDPR